jgi:type VI secretion system secreted protein Hcp
LIVSINETMNADVAESCNDAVICERSVDVRMLFACGPCRLVHTEIGAQGMFSFPHDPNERPRMSYDTFIELDGIQGESRDADHPGAIDVWTWQWKLHQAPGTLYNVAAQAPRATVQDFVFTHGIDRASPSLVRYCYLGKHVPTVKVFARKAGEVPQDFLLFTLEDAMITGVETTGGGTTMIESVSISFVRMRYEYALQDALGEKKEAVTALIDLRGKQA